jgi:hypothetical protein
MFRKWLVSVLGLMLLGLLYNVRADDAGQVVVSATPVQITLASPTPFAVQPVASTPTVTRTPTPIGAALLEAKADAGAVNVRAQPDPNADKLGTISSGETYPILGRYFEWYQFQYDPSPNKMGWVFGQLVDIIGDPSTIEDLNANLLPTVDTSSLNLTQTWEAVTLTPGGLLTATAEARVIAVPNAGTLGPEATIEPNLANSVSTAQVLPTFTYPPEIAAQAPTQAVDGDPIPTAAVDTVTAVVFNGIAPIVPILVLGGLGILGLAVSSIRR